MVNLLNKLKYGERLLKRKVLECACVVNFFVPFMRTMKMFHGACLSPRKMIMINMTNVTFTIQRWLPSILIYCKFIWLDVPENGLFNDYFVYHQLARK